MLYELELEINKENCFQHIFLVSDIKEWGEVKYKYHEKQKHRIDNFEPVIFLEEDLKSQRGIEELINILLEGRKYKKIALIKVSNEKEFKKIWEVIDKGLKSVVYFNTTII